MKVRKCKDEVRTVKNHTESVLAKGSKINSKSFLNFADWRKLEERRLLVSEDRAESKDRVVLVLRVSTLPQASSWNAGHCMWGGARYVHCTMKM